MKKIKAWFKSNKSNIAIIILFLSSLLLCANLFSGISDPVITIIGCVFTITGMGIVISDMIEGKEND